MDKQFTCVQLDRLQTLGLTGEEIQALETNALPIVENYRQRPPATAGLRDSLGDLRDRLQSTMLALKISESPGSDEVSAQVLRRLALADYQYGREKLNEPFQRTIDEAHLGLRLNAAKSAIEEALVVIATALQNCPKEQRRERAYWEPIDAIHAAVLTCPLQAYQSKVEVQVQG